MLTDRSVSNRIPCSRASGGLACRDERPSPHGGEEPAPAKAGVAEGREGALQRPPGDQNFPPQPPAPPRLSELISPTYPRPSSPWYSSPHCAVVERLETNEGRRRAGWCGGRLASGGGIGSRASCCARGSRRRGPWSASVAEREGGSSPNGSRTARTGSQAAGSMPEPQTPDREAGPEVPLLAGLPGWTNGPASPLPCPEGEEHPLKPEAARPMDGSARPQS